MNETITLTDLDIERLRSPKGAFTRRTIDALGIPWLMGTGFPPKGWVRRLRGEVISRANYESALAAATLPKLRNVPHGDARGQMSLL